MNTLKRTLALVATLAMASTAFVGCGKEDPSSSTPESSAPESSVADESSEAPAEDGGDDAETPAEDGGDDASSSGEIDASVGQGGSTFTVAAWNPDDVPYLIAQWKGLDYSTVAQDLADDKVDGIKFISFGVGGGDASERYDQLFTSGDDLDVYFCEADWALNYINDDTKTLALEKLGLGDDTWPNMYGYTDAIGKSESGVRKGVSWQAAAGGLAYRAD
ncbi:MAG: carbohydrate ABC transporter substrate-binding protein, partial [Ruminococcus sp.]|nr:carbohydrate ABC transporter substrate-binding protein [Ruminococcus sp.]